MKRRHAIPGLLTRNSGFTLIELLVALAASVILMSILSFVFATSINAMRATAGQISMTERIRALDSRLRQEVGAMLPTPRVQNPAQPGDAPNPGMGANYYVSPAGDELTFTTATVENGRPVTVDVRYKLENDPANPGRKLLIRYRDSTGPYLATDPNKLNTDTSGNSKCVLGDYNFITPYDRADIILSGIASTGFLFSVVNVPVAAPSPDIALYRTTLPAAIRLTVTFTPDLGNPNMVQTAALTFPIYRGL